MAVPSKHQAEDSRYKAAFIQTGDKAYGNRGAK
jgi:hypothetical protein